MSTLFSGLNPNSGFHDSDLLAKSKYNSSTLSYDIATEKVTLLELTNYIAGTVTTFSGNYNDLTNQPVTITGTQASDITANNAKVSYTDSAAVAANTAKISYTDSVAVGLNTAKISYTDSAAVTANTAKLSATGTELEPTDIDTLAELNAIITDATLVDTGDSRFSDARTPLAHTHTASEVTDFDTEVSNNASVAANTAKISYTDSAAVTANTAKISYTDATAVGLNTAKVTFPEAPNDGQDYVRKSLGWSVVSSGSATGVVSITDAAGEPTFYTTLQLAIDALVTAATFDAWITLHADIVETANVSVTIKNRTNINLNGHTYTLNSGGLASAFLDDASSNDKEVSIINGKIISLNSTADYCCFFDNIHLIGTGLIIEANVSFYALRSKYGASNIKSKNTGVSANARGIVSPSTEANWYNCTGESSVGIGFWVSSGGLVYNCIGISVDGIGCYASNCTIRKSIGKSNTNFGFQSAGTCNSYDNVGESISGTGHYAGGSYNHKGLGESSSGYGYEGVANKEHIQPIGISTSSLGMYVLSTSAVLTKILSPIARSSSAVAANFNIYGTASIYISNGDFDCTWNALGGSALQLRSDTGTTTIVNSSCRVANVGAYCVTTPLASTINYSGMSFTGSTTAVDPLITQGITNTADSQGNILT